jgi:peptidoglycan/xylan/chitin deacetylase (PgdA/CDA1 family)
MIAAGGASAGAQLHGHRLGLRNVPMVLMYHGIADVPEDPNQLCVSPGRFAEQMAWMDRRGLRGVSVGRLVEAMSTGSHRGLVGITFDDGYANVLESALPQLQRRGFTASVFIISRRLGGSNDWDDGPAWPLLDAGGVRELAAAGMEIGSHSATHVRLAGLDPDQLAAEVAASKADLAALLQTEIRGFAFPYGSMDAAARRAVHDAGYAYACAVETPRSELGLMALPRIYVGDRDSAVRMTAKRHLYRGYIAIRGRHG